MIILIFFPRYLQVEQWTFNIKASLGRKAVSHLLSQGKDDLVLQVLGVDGPEAVGEAGTNHRL